MVQGRVVSVQVGKIETMEYRGRKTRTGINKRPVAGPVQVHELGLDGDRQADPRFHGGPNKAVYLYPSEHYPFWKEWLAAAELPFGAFGENLTTEGVLESELRRGMKLRIGSALFEVTTRREPCYKLGSKLGNMDVLPELRANGRSGYYLKVLEEGSLQSGDAIEEAP